MWQLKISYQKCAITNIGANCLSSDSTYCLGQQPLATVKVAKDLVLKMFPLKSKCSIYVIGQLKINFHSICLKQELVFKRPSIDLEVIPGTINSVEHLQCAKVLGVFVDSKLSFVHHVEFLLKVCSQRFYLYCNRCVSKVLPMTVYMSFLILSFTIEFCMHCLRGVAISVGMPSTV